MAKNKSINQLIARAIPGSKGTSNWFTENIKFDTPAKYGLSIVVHFGLSVGSTGIIEYTIDNGLTYHTFLNTMVVGDKAGVEREITLSGGNKGDITNYADSAVDPGTKTTVTHTNHLLQEGDVVEISGDLDYDGVYAISNVTLDTFDILTSFINNGTGKFDSADRFNIRSQVAVSIDFCKVDIV